MTDQEIIIEKWKRGRLAYKLRPHQIPLYEQVWAAIQDHTVKYGVCASRRFGKSTVLALIAIEFCIRNPKSIVRFAAPTISDLEEIVHYNVQLLSEDCPKGLGPCKEEPSKPHWKKDVLYFANGSEIHTAGCNNGHYVNLRGHTSHLSLIDEGGFIDELESAVDGVLLPQTMSTHGTTVIASTPPEAVDHAFTEMFHSLKEEGNTCTYTIDDDTWTPDEVKQKWIDAIGGIVSTKVQREFFCKFITEQSKLIIPEWSEKYVQSYPKDDLYQFYKHYVALDFGVRDFTCALFATYDFRDSKLYVEDELWWKDNELTTDIMQEAIKKKEEELWKKPADTRIGDSKDKLELNNLSITYNLMVNPVKKGSTTELMIGDSKVWVRQGRVLVDPKCTYLINCLKFGIWDKSEGGTLQFKRSKKYGHYDALASFCYLTRSIDVYNNPVPFQYGRVIDFHKMRHPKGFPQQMSHNETVLTKALGL